MSDLNEKWYQKTFNTDKFVKEFVSTNPIFKTSIDTNTVFINLLKNILDKPFWVKQALYLELRDDINKVTNVDLLGHYSKSDLLQLYKPVLNHLGIKVIEDKVLMEKYKISAELTLFLSNIDGQLNVIDLCYKNSWTLEYFAKRIIEAFDKDLVEPLQTRRIYYVFKYLASQMDIPSVLLKLNKITEEQLYNATKYYNQMQKTFNDEEIESLESVLVRLNYITQDRIDSLKVLKEASTHILDDSSNTEASELQTINFEFIQSLSEDNKKITDIIENYEFMIQKKDKIIQSQQTEIEKLKSELENQKSSNNIFKKL